VETNGEAYTPVSRISRRLVFVGLSRFPPFDFDSGTLRLRKHGFPVKLQRKPALILAALLDEPSKSLTREELYASLWPSDTFVDFDQSLNVAIKKLRDALNDSAEERRFIETVAGLGYRFIGELLLVEQAVAHVVPETYPVPVKSNHRLELRVVLAALSGVALLGVVTVLLAYSNRMPSHYWATNFRQITRSGTEKTPFTTDGERIYFFNSQGEKTFFTQVSVNGGATLQVPAVANVLPYQADLLNDELVYLDGNWHEYLEQGKGAQVWVRQLPAGTPWKIPDVRCQSVSWTKDGDILCAVRGEFSIIDLEGKQVRKLFKAWSSAFRAHLSPDEKKLRFEMAADDPRVKRWEIWESAADGSNLHPLAPELAVSCCGSWSNDGSLYVFEVWDGARWDVWALPKSAGWLSHKADPIRLTSGPLDARYPKVSADGKRVYFMGADFRGELSSVDEKTGQLVPFLTGGSITELDFSPDRQWITYVAYPEGTLWRSRLDGSERLQLTRPPLLAYAPKFSRDGQRIFFGDIGGSDKVYAVPVEGGKPQFLLDGMPKCTSDAAPPSDMSFEFVGWCDMESGGTALQVADPDSGQAWKIPASDGLVNPAVSPDGRFIAAVGRHSGKLMLFRIKTRNWSELPIPQSDNPGAVAWSPNSKLVYVRQESAILRTTISNRHTEIAARLPKSGTYLWWGNWFGISPQGKILITRQSGAGDIYAFDLQKN